MSYHFEDMVSSHGPAEVEDSASTIRVVNLLTVSQNQPLSGGDTPYDCDIVLFTTARSPRFSVRESLWIGKTKPPAVEKKMMCKSKNEFSTMWRAYTTSG